MKNTLVNRLDFSKGLIPTIAQDMEGKILMLAYSSPESVQLTIDEGFGWYYSRSRTQLWKKGETSGNFQRVKNIYVDCDNDSLIYLIEQTGNACHLGKYSCFTEVE